MACIASARGLDHAFFSKPARFWHENRDRAGVAALAVLETVIVFLLRVREIRNSTETAVAFERLGSPTARLSYTVITFMLMNLRDAKGPPRLGA